MTDLVGVLKHIAPWISTVVGVISAILAFLKLRQERRNAASLVQEIAELRKLLVALPTVGATLPDHTEDFHPSTWQRYHIFNDWLRQALSINLERLGFPLTAIALLAFSVAALAAPSFFSDRNHIEIAATMLAGVFGIASMYLVFGYWLVSDRFSLLVTNDGLLIQSAVPGATHVVAQHIRFSQIADTRVSRVNTIPGLSIKVTEESKIVPSTIFIPSKEPSSLLKIINERKR